MLICTVHLFVINLTNFLKLGRLYAYSPNTCLFWNINMINKHLAGCHAKIPLILVLNFEYIHVNPQVTYWNSWWTLTKNLQFRGKTGKMNALTLSKQSIKLTEKQDVLHLSRSRIIEKLFFSFSAVHHITFDFIHAKYENLQR